MAESRARTSSSPPKESSSYKSRPYKADDKQRDAKGSRGRHRSKRRHSRSRSSSSSSSSDSKSSSSSSYSSSSSSSSSTSRRKSRKSDRKRTSSKKSRKESSHKKSKSSKKHSKRSKSSKDKKSDRSREFTEVEAAEIAAWRQEGGQSSSQKSPGVSGATDSGFDAVAYGKAAADLLASKDYKQYRTQLSHEKKAARVTSGPFVPAVSQQTFEDKMKHLKASKMHRSLVSAVKLGNKIAAKDREETAKMDALLASVGLSRTGLASGEQAPAIQPRSPK